MDNPIVRPSDLPIACSHRKFFCQISRWSAFAIVLSVLGLVEWRAFAKPRSALPPAPESAILRMFRFDEAIYPYPAALVPMNAQNAPTVESWSGLALRVAGTEPALVQYPEVSSDGHTNINCRTGAVRFWFKPDWSSTDLGGTGPGSYARFIEMGAPSQDARFGWWSLYLNPQGTAIHFSAQGKGRSADFLQAPLHWSAGTWHEVLLMYTATSSQLYVDGELASQGAGVSVWPGQEVRSSLGFAVGSDMAGESRAQGEFEELATYWRPLGLMEWDWVYRMRARQAALGPVTPEEEQRIRSSRQMTATFSQERLVFTAMDGPPPLPGGGGGTNGSGGTISNPPPYSVPGLKVTIPKFVNQKNDFVFWVLEPQSNAVYELQFATNLNSPIAWNTLVRGLHGQTNYVIPVPTATNGFFRLRVPYIAGPPILIVPEDTSITVSNLQANGFTGAVGTVSLRVTNGFLKVTTTNGLTLSGNGSSNLTATGTQENLNTSLLGLRYQGNTNYFGPDGLTATVTNAGGTISEILKIGIIVTPVNDTPTAVGHSYTVAEDTTLLIQTPGVLASGTDPEGDPMTAVLVSGPSHGVLNLNPNGSFSYLPNLNYVGSDSFIFRANDAGSGGSATVNITITAVNEPPSVQLTSPTNGASIAVGVGINLAVSATDVDGTVASVSYYNGLNLIGTVTSSPFSLTWTNPGLGTYTLTAKATDNSGAVGTSLPVTFTVSSDCDSDGVSDAVEIGTGTDPCDFFNGAVPILTIVSGNYQTGPADSVLPEFLKVRVSNSAGIVRSNVPVTFNVTDGLGRVAQSTNGPWTNSIILNTDSNGLAGAAFKLPSTGSSLSLVRASAGSNASIARVTFAEASAGPVDGWVLDNYPVAVSAGGQHTLALLLDGTVRAWGWNGQGQLGISTNTAFSSTPVQVPNLSNVVAISAGAWHSLALKADGTVAAWGQYWEYQLPTPPAGLSTVVAISAGKGHSMALKSDGTLSTWGSSFDNHHTPPAGLSTVKAISAGDGFSLALKSNGTVTAWGLNQYYSNYGQTNVPAGLSDIQAIAAGAYHALALRSNGTVVSWGRNNYGQTNVPSALTNVVAIDAGETHSLALLANGTVTAWGNTNSSQLSGLNNVTAISAGGSDSVSHSVALKSDGTVMSWGANGNGQLGNNSQTTSWTPVQAVGLPPPPVTISISFKVYTPLK